MIGMEKNKFIFFESMPENLRLKPLGLAYKKELRKS